MFLFKKLLRFVVMSYFVVLFLNLPFQRVFSNIWLILLLTLSSLASITSCIGRLMVWQWVPHWQINIFIGFCEVNLFNKIDCPPCIIVMLMTLSVYLKMRKMLIYFTQLNSMHSSLKFTVEKESNHRLPFLDVLVHKTFTAFITSVNRKPTFSGLYTRWDSFCPQQHKINLIKTLVYHARMISSKCFIGDEIKFIKSTLSKNGYPLSILDGVVHDVMIKFDRASRCTVNKCPVYLHLLYIGSRGERFAKSITAAVG